VILIILLLIENHDVFVPLTESGFKIEVSFYRGLKWPEILRIWYHAHRFWGSYASWAPEALAFKWPKRFLTDWMVFELTDRCELLICIHHPHTFQVLRKIGLAVVGVHLWVSQLSGHMDCSSIAMIRNRNDSISHDILIITVSTTQIESLKKQDKTKKGV
jgi:hypothetical protein